MIYIAGKPKKQLSPSEAIYGFGSWLSIRKEPVCMGANHDCAIVAELIDQYCKAQNLKEPKDHWEDNLIPMKNLNVR